MLFRTRVPSPLHVNDSCNYCTVAAVLFLHCENIHLPNQCQATDIFEWSFNARGCLLVLINRRIACVSSPLYSSASPASLGASVFDVYLIDPNIPASFSLADDRGSIMCVRVCEFGCVCQRRAEMRYWLSSCKIEKMAHARLSNPMESWAAQSGGVGFNGKVCGS